MKGWLCITTVRGGEESFTRRKEVVAAHTVPPPVFSPRIVHLTVRLFTCQGGLFVLIYIPRMVYEIFNIGRLNRTIDWIKQSDRYTHIPNKRPESIFRVGCIIIIIIIIIIVWPPSSLLLSLLEILWKLVTWWSKSGWNIDILGLTGNSLEVNCGWITDSLTD